MSSARRLGNESAGGPSGQPAGVYAACLPLPFLGCLAGRGPDCLSKNPQSSTSGSWRLIDSLNESCAKIDGLIGVTQYDVIQYYIVERGTLTTSSRSS